MRTDFEMTQDDLDELLTSMQSAPMIALQCGTTPSVQERANAAWERLGKRMGFDYMTVRPNVKGDRFFSAVAKPCQGYQLPDGNFSGCNASGGDCPVCGK